MSTSQVGTKNNKYLVEQSNTRVETVLLSKKERAQHEKIWGSPNKPLNKYQRGKVERDQKRQQKNQTTYRVASSKIDELRDVERRERNARNDQYFKVVLDTPNPQTIENKLYRTKACNFVAPKDGVWGVCNREKCDFAHGFDELKFVPCMYGRDCNKFNGTRDRETGDFDQTKKCQFFHEGESVDQFFTRTGKPRPLLPDNSTRPKVSEVVKSETKVEVQTAIPFLNLSQEEEQELKDTMEQAKTVCEKLEQSEQNQGEQSKAQITVSQNGFERLMDMISNSEYKDFFEVTVQ